MEVSIRDFVADVTLTCIYGDDHIKECFPEESDPVVTFTYPKVINGQKHVVYSCEAIIDGKTMTVSQITTSRVRQYIVYIMGQYLFILKQWSHDE